MSNCDEFRTLITALLDRELSVGAAARVEEHLQICQLCAKALAEYGMLQNATAMADLPQTIDLWARISDEISDEAATSTLDDSLTSLYRNGTISYEKACARATDRKLLGPAPAQTSEAAAENRSTTEGQVRKAPIAPKNSLGESLVDKRVITEEQLKTAREVQMSARGDLGNIIQDLGYASENDIAKVRATVLGMQFADLNATPPAEDALKSVPDHIVKKYNIIPVKRMDNRLVVAVGNVKASMAGLDEVRLVSGCIVFPVLAGRTDIEDAINIFYPTSDISPNPDETSKNV